MVQSKSKRDSAQKQISAYNDIHEKIEFNSDNWRINNQELEIRYGNFKRKGYVLG